VTMPAQFINVVVRYKDGSVEHHAVSLAAHPNAYRPSVAIEIVKRELERRADMVMTYEVEEDFL